MNDGKVSAQSVLDEYWQHRVDSIYLQVVRHLVTGVADSASSLLDVGSAACPYLEWYDWIPTRTSLDLRNPYTGPGVNSIRSDFLKWEPDREYDVVTCLQVMEHVPAATEFAQKLLSVGKIVVVSLPYKWKAGNTSSHVHDPVDEEKVLDWFGRKPNYEYIAREVKSGARRIIHVYERDKDRRWPSTNVLRRMREQG